MPRTQATDTSRAPELHLRRAPNHPSSIEFLLNPSLPGNSTQAPQPSTEASALPSASLPDIATTVPQLASQRPQLEASSISQQDPPGQDGFLDEINACHIDLHRVFRDLQHKRESRLGRKVSSAQADASRSSWAYESARAAMTVINRDLGQPLPQLPNMRSPVSASQQTQQEEDHQPIRRRTRTSTEVAGGGVPVATSAITASFSAPVVPSHPDYSGVTASGRMPTVQQEQEQEQRRYHPSLAPSFHSSFAESLQQLRALTAYTLQRRVRIHLEKRFRDDLNR
jgi:hypothetical protein